LPVEPGKHNITVVGPGAMGCLFASLLHKAGNRVCLLDRRPDRAKLISRQGVIVSSGEKEETVQVKATANPQEAGPASLLVMCVKAYDTMKAAKRSKPAAAQDAQVLSLQNGAGNVEALVEVFGEQRVLGGVTAQGANLKGPGRVIHAGEGETLIGQPDRGTDRAKKAADIFNAAGIKTSVTRDLQGAVWSKLLINAAINPLTALLGVNNGALPEMDQTRWIMERAVREVQAVAARMGIGIGFLDPYEKALAVARATGQNISSMLADVRAGRRTEIEQINGAVAKRAQELGVPAPVNQVLALLVKAMENQGRMKT